MTTINDKRQRESKYAIYDDILGSSLDFTWSKKKKRLEVYEDSKIHSLTDILNILKARKLEEDLRFEIRATIPYSNFCLPFEPSSAEL